MTRVVHKTCNLCEAMCGLRIEVADGKIGRIEGDPNDPMSHGALCPKAIALKEIQEDPDRLQRPMRRRGGAWEEISWDEAFQEAVSRIARLQGEHGNDAMASYLGNPGAHNLGVLFGLTPLYGALETRNRYSASSLDQNPKHATSQLLFGNWLRVAIPDVDRTDFLLMLGANPIVSGGSLMTAPGFRKRIDVLQARGGKLVVVDPRRTETARLADRHLFIRPGMDGLLLAALVHVVIEEKLGRDDPLADRRVGIEKLTAAVSPFSPEAVATSLGWEAQALRALAREFAAAPTAVCYGRVGTSQHIYGTLCTWLAEVLNLLTGNIDRAGGAMFPTPAADLAALGEMRDGGAEREFLSGTTRVRGAPRYNDESPTACLTEEITTPGKGQIRGLLTVAGNPVLSAPNGAALGRALEGLDTYIAIDFYLNETTQHADLILPPTWSLEHDNCEVLFHSFAVRNTAKYSPAVVAPQPHQRDDWQILTELGLRLSAAKATSPFKAVGWKAALRLLPLVTPRRLLGWMLRTGTYGDGYRPWRKGLRLRDLEDNPSGVDLGPLVPRLREMLGPDGVLDVGPTIMLDELSRLQGELAAPPKGLVLIGRRDIRTCNSWLHNTRVGTKGRERCTLQMHSEDARKQGLVGRDTVVITSRVGEVEAPLELSDDLMPGVVSLPHGWGHRGPGLRMATAESHPGVSCNDLVDDQVIEPVVGNAVFNGVPVTVKAAS